MENKRKKEKELKIRNEDFIMTKSTKISKEYVMGKTLGKGSFGQVRLAVHKATKQTRAVKILKKTNENLESLIKEVQVLAKLYHPNIMQMYEVFEDKANVYIVSEFCKGGELFDVISQRGSFCEKEAAIIMKEILSAICYSHQNHIIHRDLKPENILLEEKGDDDLSIKIIDWGCAKTFKKSERLHAVDGTPYYIAPEVLQGDYDEKCDVWSCGIILYILLCGYPPFNGENDEEIYYQVLKGQLEFPDEEWAEISKEAKALITKMLTRDSTERYSALQSLDDIWFQNNKGDSKTNTFVAKNVLTNMQKFKKDRKLEQATVGFIINQIVGKDERKELKKQFQEWDKNGDGVLSQEEIVEGYRTTYNKVDENEIENMIKSVDLDGNGVIDYNEFLLCATNKEKVINNENLEMCFKAFDLDGSGKISLDELIMVFKKSDKAEAYINTFKKILKDADSNGDGEISLEEFKHIMNEFYK